MIYFLTQGYFLFKAIKLRKKSPYQFIVVCSLLLFSNVLQFGNKIKKHLVYVLRLIGLMFINFLAMVDYLIRANDCGLTKIALSRRVNTNFHVMVYQLLFTHLISRLALGLAAPELFLFTLLRMSINFTVVNLLQTEHAVYFHE